jgi:hypothetical protein
MTRSIWGRRSKKQAFVAHNPIELDHLAVHPIPDRRKAIGRPITISLYEPAIPHLKPPRIELLAGMVEGDPALTGFF